MIDWFINLIGWGESYEVSWWGNVNESNSWGIVYPFNSEGSFLTIDTTSQTTDTTYLTTDKITY